MLPASQLRLDGSESATPHSVDKSTTLPLSYQPTVPMASVAPTTPTLDNDATADDAAPSRLALLQRAAELGMGPRLSLDNIGMAPVDPILAKKHEPGIVERRARFRTVVKVALGLCAGFCLFATAATVLSSNASASTSSTSGSTAVHSTAPASVVTEKETLEVATTTKAEKVAVATPAPRRWGKRR